LPKIILKQVKFVKISRGFMIVINKEMKVFKLKFPKTNSKQNSTPREEDINS